MRAALGSDEKTTLTDAVVGDLEKRGIEVLAVGPVAGESMAWGAVAERVGRIVADRRADFGVLFCWTGTGVSIVANKVSGVRAALCADAETARGARRWNDANVLVMSLRATSVAVAREIVDAWLSAQPDDSERPSWEIIERLDAARR
ncbi:MAG: RpiB/LacA/LacB family sugar-phosphate isomerase [Deltaproteobacteria bacterium]|nr:RpiB/LacA/LacB family sugar-phosphate isomerase [Deltaproteobacteria bacterium]